MSARKNIFHSASLKLTAMYLATIVLISLVFSTHLYRVTSEEINRTVHRQNGPVAQMMRQRSPELYEEFEEDQEAVIEEATRRLKVNLVVTNISILIAGGIVSYYFARRTLQPIEEAHEAQSRFTADASHELRTPITAMRIETELTLTEPNLTLADAKKQLESNIEELDKLTELSEKMLSLARLEISDKEREELQLKKVIDTAVNKVKPQSKIKKQKIEVGQIPAVKVLGSLDVLSEAFVTIIDNAVKYIDDGGSISLNFKEQKNDVEIKIIDTGIGIKASDLSHIFERFYRADQSRNKTTIQGYGIGLSIAKSTIESHGGSIKVASTINKGTTFTLNLPIVRQ